MRNLRYIQKLLLNCVCTQRLICLLNFILWFWFHILFCWSYIILFFNSSISYEWVKRSHHELFWCFKKRDFLMISSFRFIDLCLRRGVYIANTEPDHVFCINRISSFSFQTDYDWPHVKINMPSGDSHLVVNLIMIELFGTIFFLAVVTICLYIKRYFVRKSLGGLKALVSKMMMKKRKKEMLMS